MYNFSMSPRDAHQQEINVGDIVRLRDRTLPYRVISINLDPVQGNWISTPDGPEQLIHARVQVEDVCGIYAPTNVLAESVIVTRPAGDDLLQIKEGDSLAVIDAQMRARSLEHSARSEDRHGIAATATRLRADAQRYRNFITRSRKGH